MSRTLDQTPLLHTEKTLAQYFETFNRGDFDATAQLFAADGQLLPPFEEPITGPEAISHYLKREAEGMQAFPKEMEVAIAEGDRRRIVVRGQVTAIVFKVNCAWIFDLNSSDEIEHVRVKLLASMQELLTLR